MCLITSSLIASLCKSVGEGPELSKYIVMMMLMLATLVNEDKDEKGNHDDGKAQREQATTRDKEERRRDGRDKRDGQDGGKNKQGRLPARAMRRPAQTPQLMLMLMLMLMLLLLLMMLMHLHYLFHNCDLLKNGSFTKNRITTQRLGSPEIVENSTFGIL